ncbi:MAG: hypothetical protein ACRED5_15290 [Propylenella sp.]
MDDKHLLPGWPVPSYDYADKHPIPFPTHFAEQQFPSFFPHAPAVVEAFFCNVLAYSSALGESMQTELKGTYRSGFELTEKDLRRVLDLATDKMRQSPDRNVKRRITYKLANGAIIETDSVDDLFGEENSGRKRITSLACEVSSESGMKADVRFIDIIEDKEERNSITYRLQGENRDPLFVLSSELEERIGSIKRRYLLPESVPYVQIIFFLSVLAAMVGMFWVMFSDIGFAIRSSAETTARARGVIERYQGGQFSQDLEGLFEFVVSIENAKLAPDVERQMRLAQAWGLIGGSIGIGLGVFTAGIVSLILLRRLHYPFNFVWGDQLAVVERRRRTKNFILVGIGVALVVGTISSYLAGLLPRL